MLLLGGLAEAGVRVAGGGDNLQDPFNLMGRGDPFEAASLLVTAGHQLPGAALAAVSGTARDVMGLPPAEVRPGAAADFVAVEAFSEREAVAAAPAPARPSRQGAWRPTRSGASSSPARPGRDPPGAAAIPFSRSPVTKAGTSPLRGREHWG